VAVNNDLANPGTEEGRESVGRPRAARSVSLRYVAAAIFALSAIVPLLLFLHVLWRLEALAQTEVQVDLLLALVIALAGFVLFQRTVQRISSVVQGLGITERHTERGLPATRDAVVPGLGHVAEIGQMAEAFRDLLDDLRASTERLQDLVFKLGTLNEMVEVAGRIPNMQELLGVVLDRTMQTVGATIGSIMLLDADGLTLRVVAAKGLPEAHLDGVVVKVGEGVAGKVLALGQPVLVEDIERDPRFGQPNNPRYGNGSFISVPIRVQNRMIGVVNLARKSGGAGSTLADPRSFNTTDLQFLNALMSYIGYAVDNARLIEEARQAATRLQRVVEDQQLRLTLAQQQMVRSAKLSALGQLVAGVAHELNNPLMVVLGLGELLNDRAPADLRDLVQQIHEAAEQARGIVRGLLTFARQQPLERRAIDVAQLIDKVLKVTGADLQLARVTVAKPIEPDLPPLWADEGQLQQVLVNLVTNARQAMSDMVGERRLRITVTRADAERLRIAVEDTGPGIKPELLPHIFDPFVTTKGAEGTGLGLSISYGIIQEHQGELSVESAPGRGARFTIELPFGTPSSTYDAAPAVPVRLAGKRVLVVEDDPAVQSLARGYLEAAGCTAAGASTAEEGLARLEASMDLILADLHLPGADGFTFYQAATARHPELSDRFVMMTGGVVTDVQQTWLRDRAIRLLAKPFSREQLLDVALRRAGGVLSL
jgi:signal transduction histidine kinase